MSRVVDAILNDLSVCERPSTYEPTIELTVRDAKRILETHLTQETEMTTENMPIKEMLLVDRDALDRLHNLLYAAQRSDDPIRQQAINDARLELSNIREKSMRINEARAVTAGAAPTHTPDEIKMEPGLALESGEFIPASELNAHEVRIKRGQQTIGNELGNLIACFDAAFAEGLIEALSETTDVRLKDLIERRLLVGYTDAIGPTKQTVGTQVPIDMLLHCPKRGLQHIDAPEEERSEDICEGPEVVDTVTVGWDNPPHRSHLCHGCGHVWRPADVPTNGVASIKTKGKADT